MRAVVPLLLTTAFCLGRPANIVFVLTDDQDVVLGGMTPLRATERLIGGEGTTFTNAFAVTPLCCPSRSSILTGLYLHSHGTVNNSLSGGCSGREWQERHERRTFAGVLQRAGYRTFYAGKYLNRYGSGGAGGVEHVPEGWDWWVGLVGNSVYYNYTLSVNGSGVRRGDGEADYLTDVLREYSLEFLKDRRRGEEPFLMVIAPPAPHEPFTPAERHKGAFSGRKAPRTGNFNVPGKGKHWLLRLPPAVLPPETVDRIDEVFRRRWESLLAVDELVEAVVGRLGELGVLSETYVMFSSDHGFHLGQFGLPWDKRQPYETDIRIPLLVRGPGVPRGVSGSPVLSIDLAASILEMGGTGMRVFGEGRSLLGGLNSVGVGGRGFLVEYWGEGGGGGECYGDGGVKGCRVEGACKCLDARNNTFTCVRRVWEGGDDKLCRFRDGEGFEEYYDIGEDPEEMENLSGGAAGECMRRAVRGEVGVEECVRV